MKKRILMTIGFFLAIIFLVTACANGSGKAPDPSQGGTEQVTPGEKKFRIGVSLADMRHPFFVKQGEGCQDAAEKYGYEIDIFSGDDDPAKQGAQVEEFVTKGVDLIVLCPCVQDGLVPFVKKANEANIPVIILNRLLGDGAESVTYVGADDFFGGQVQAGIIGDGLNGKGNVVLVQGTLGSSPQVNRQAGLESGLATNFPDIEIVDRFPSDFDKAKAMTITQDVLTKYPEGTLDAIVAQCSETAMGVMEVVVAAGRTDVKVVGFDNPSYVRDAIAEGKMFGTVLQDPYLQAMLAMDMVWMHLAGHAAHVPSPRFTTPLTPVTIENADTSPPSW